MRRDTTLVRTHFLSFQAQHVNRPLVEIVEIQENTILFDDEDLLPQTQYGVQLFLAQLRKGQGLPVHRYFLSVIFAGWA
jgi:hypothetical protein